MFIIAVWFNENTYNVANLRIFKKTNADGIIYNEGAAWVMPVKENNLTEWQYLDFKVTVKTNSRGLREDFEVKDNETDIAFFGDSFTFGHGVEGQEKYSTVLSKQDAFKNYKVVNFSYPNGWQPEHYEYFFKKSPDLKPKLAVVGLYLGNDFDSDPNETIYNRDSCILKTPYRMVSKEGYLRNRPDIYRFPLFPLVKYSSFVKLVLIKLNATALRKYLYADISKTTNRLNSAEIENGTALNGQNRAILALKEIKKTVEARGGKLVVLIIPQDYYFCADKASIHIDQNLKKELNELISGDNILKKTKLVLSEADIDFFDPSTFLNADHYFKMMFIGIRQGIKLSEIHWPLLSLKNITIDMLKDIWQFLIERKNFGWHLLSLSC